MYLRVAIYLRLRSYPAPHTTTTAFTVLPTYVGPFTALPVTTLYWLQFCVYWFATTVVTRFGLHVYTHYLHFGRFAVYRGWLFTVRLRLLPGLYAHVYYCTTRGCGVALYTLRPTAVPFICCRRVHAFTTTTPHTFTYGYYTPHLYREHYATPTPTFSTYPFT